MLKDAGHSKKKKFIKCDNCKQQFELEEDEIIKLGNITYVECPYCGQQKILKS